MLYDDVFYLYIFIFVRYLFMFSSRPSPGSRGLDLGGGDCSDRPDQNVSDPDRLLCLLYIFVAAIFLRFGGGEIKHYRFVSQLIKSLPLYFARLQLVTPNVETFPVLSFCE